MTHTPKWRALMAFDADALSDEGTRRISTHVERCDTCRKALAEIAAFEAVARETRQTPHTVDWSAMELALKREARMQSRALRAASTRRRWALPAVGLAVAAAALLWVWIGTNATDSTAPVATTTPLDNAHPPLQRDEEPLVVDDPVEQVEARILALAGAPRVSGTVATLGGELSEGDVLELGSGQELHAAMELAAAFALKGESSLTVQKLRPDDIRIVLAKGEVHSTVKPGQPFSVHAAPYDVRVRGTRFHVARDDKGVTVTVDEGSVEVLQQGELLASLEAPAQWSSQPEHAALDNGSVAQVSRHEHRLAPLRFPSSDRFVRWEVGEETLAGTLPAAMLVTVGEHQVVAYDASGRRFFTTVTALAEGTDLEERALRRVRTGPAVGFLATEAIQAAVRPTLRQLKACYERDLRRTNPNLAGDYTLRVRVDRDGSVSQVRVATEDDLPPTLRACLVRHASAWTFPEPEGGPVTFDLPLNLSTR